MSASRVRVRQPVSFAGLALLLAFAAMAWGLVGGSGFRLSFALLPPPFRFISVYVWVALGVTMVLLWLPLLCHRYRTVFLAGLVAGGLYAIGYALAWEIMLAGFVEWTWKGWIEDLVGIVAVGLVLGLLAMLSLLICRTFAFTLITQDGTLCNRCGYAVGKTDASVCAECGNERDTNVIAPRGGNLANWLGARARVATIALVTIIAALLLWLTWLQWPYMQFRLQFHESSVWVRTDSYQPDFPVLNVSATQPLAELGEEARLIVDLARSNPFSAARIRVRVGTVGGARGMVRDGTPRIICELRSRQARMVLRDGVPQDLIDRLIENAHEKNWSPDRQTMYREQPETVWVQPP